MLVPGNHVNFPIGTKIMILVKVTLMIIYVGFVFTEPPIVSEMIEVYRRWTKDKDRRQVMTIIEDTCIAVPMLDNNRFKETFPIYIHCVFVHSYKRESWWKPLWSWSCVSWIDNYLCNQWVSALKLWVQIPLMVRCTWYNFIW